MRSIPPMNPTQSRCYVNEPKDFSYCKFYTTFLRMSRIFFPEDAFRTYFPTPAATPFEVEKFPKVSASCGTYAGELANYVTGNPQGDISSSENPTTYAAATTQAPPNKRNRQGDLKTNDTATAQPAPDGSSTAMKTIHEAQATLTQLQNANNTNESTITQINTTLTTLTNRIGGNEAAIQALADTQVQQSGVLNTLTQKQNALEKNMLTLCNHFGLQAETSEPTPQPPPS